MEKNSQSGRGLEHVLAEGGEVLKLKSGGPGGDSAVEDEEFSKQGDEMGSPAEGGVLQMLRLKGGVPCSDSEVGDEELKSDERKQQQDGRSMDLEALKTFEDHIVGKQKLQV